MELKSSNEKFKQVFTRAHRIRPGVCDGLSSRQKNWESDTLPRKCQVLVSDPALETDPRYYGPSFHATEALPRHGNAKITEEKR